MTVEQLRPTLFRVTLHAYELSALVAGARWAVEHGDLPADARKQLVDVLEQFDTERNHREGPPQS